MQVPYPHMTGVILAGGKSIRFGEDKALARFDGVPFVFRVLKAVKNLFPKILLLTNSPREHRCLPAKVICDDIPHLGPLGGIVTALRHTQDDRIFVVACDLPLIHQDDIHTIIGQSEGYDAAIPVHREKPNYVMAVYSRSLLKPMQDYLDSGDRSLKDFCRTLDKVRWIPLDGSSAININTKQDLAALEAQHALG